MTSDCTQCDGTGWRPVEIDGVRRVTRCDHGASARRRAEPITVFVDPVFRARLSQDEGAILEIILAHRGAENPIKIREIVDLVWPQAIEVQRTLQEEQDCQREVKRAVAKFREEGRIPIAGSKGSDGGYFVPAGQDELQDCHDRLLREGWKLIALSQLFVRDKELGDLLAAKAVDL